MEVVNAYRTDATRERSFRQRACHALIGENPPAEKIKRGDASNPQNSAEWRCEEARNFKNLTHYIPPTAVLFTRYKLLIVVFLLAGPCTGLITDVTAAGHLSRRSLPRHKH